MKPKKLKKRIKQWQTKVLGQCTVLAALEMADAFSVACMTSKKIPVWAMALRSLTCRVRLQGRHIANLEKELADKQRQIILLEMGDDV